MEGQALIGGTPAELIGEYAGYAGKMRGEKANHRRNLLAEARDRGYWDEARDAERT